MNVRFLSEAALEIKEAISYSRTNFELGEELSSTLKASIDGIAADPYRFSEKRDGFRTIKLLRFPYRLFFLIDETNQTVVVCALAHTSRRPGYWKPRISGL